MSVIGLDGFDHYINTDQMLDGLWAEIVGGVDVSLDATDPRTGSHALRVRMNGTTVVRKILPSPYTTLGVGFGYKMDKLPDTTNRCGIIQFRNEDNEAQITLFVQPTGQISVRQGITGGGAGIEVANSGSNLLQDGAWNHIEMRVVCDELVGKIELRVNQQVWIDKSGIDTANDVPVNIQMFVLGSPNGGVSNDPTILYDDLFWWDTNGSRNNTFMGDQKVLTLFPDGNDANQDWSVSGAGSGYEAIDETPADDDTSYIEATDVDSISDFTVEDIPAETGVINIVSAVSVYSKQKKTDAGTANSQMSVLVNGVSGNGEDRPVTTAYTYYTDIFEVSPDTGTTWTEDEINSMKLRIKKTV